MRVILILIYLCLMVLIVPAQTGVRISQFPAAAAATDADIFWIDRDPYSAGSSRKITTRAMFGDILGPARNLTDPGADRLLFWDDSLGIVDWLVLGTNLSITGNTLNATGGSGSSAPTNTIVSLSTPASASGIWFSPDTTGTNAQSSALTLSAIGTLGFPDGIRQVFNPNGTTAGINVGLQAGDPSTPFNGDLWYDSTSNELTARINGSNVALGSGGGGTPGGSNTQIQYNNAGAFGGAAAMTYDLATLTPTIDRLKIPYWVERDETNVVGNATFDLSGPPVLQTTNTSNQTITLFNVPGAGYVTWLIRLTGNGTSTFTIVPPSGYVMEPRWGVFANPPRSGQTEYYLTRSGTTIYQDTQAPFTLSDMPSQAASTLLGRGDSGAGVPQVLTLGTGLSITGTTLNASATGTNAPIFVQTSDVTVANTASETSIIGTVVGSVTFSTNFFTAGRNIHFQAWGRLSSDAAAPGTVNVKVKLGSTVVLTTTALTIPAGITADYWELFGDITCRTVGASGTVMGAGMFTLSDGSTRIGQELQMVNTTTSTIDTTAAMAFGATWQWGTADTDNTTTSTHFILSDGPGGGGGGSGGGGGGSGTVTSVSSTDLLPLFTVAITSPTTTPNLIFSAVNKAANTVYAGPSSGGAADPDFRLLVDADIPDDITLNQPTQVLSYTGTNVTVDASTGRRFFKVTLTQNTGLLITGGIENDLFELTVKQNSTGGWALNTATNFIFSATLPSPITVTTNANYADLYKFKCLGSDAWLQVGSLQKFLSP